VWDFCCDHGYLGTWALQNLFPAVHFVDPVSSIIDRIEERSRPYEKHNEGRIFFHRTLGQNIDQIVTGNVAVLGVGPHVIREILDSLWQKKCLKAQRLILGPQRNPEKLEAWINQWKTDHQIQSVDQKLLLEKGRERVIFTLDLTET
jgi:tRNA (adenine22-N1)-methyltransferase